MTEISTVRVLRRKVRLIPLVGLIFFSVSGGPFGLEPAIAWSGPGLTIVLILVIPLVFALPCALMSAELGSAIPVDGGFFYWVKAGLGRGPAYVEGIISWTLSFLDLTIYPVLFVGYLQHALSLTYGSTFDLHRFSLWSTAGGHIRFDLSWMLCVLFVAAFGMVTARGAKVVGDTSVGLLVLVMAPLLVLSAIGVWRGLRGDLTSLPFVAKNDDGTTMSVFQAVGSGLSVVIWNYIGWDAVSTVAQEIDRPQRTYPLALFISVPLITACYLGPIVALLTAHPDVDALGEQSYDLVNAASALGGRLLMVAVGLGALLSQVGLFSAILLSSAKLPQVIARDGFAPTRLMAAHPRFGTPARSLTVLCVFVAVFSAMDFQTIINSDITLSLAGLALEFLALIALRVRFPLMLRPFRVPGGLPGAIAVTVPVFVLLGWLLFTEYGDEADGPGVLLGVWALLAITVSWAVVKRFADRQSGLPRTPLDTQGTYFGPGIDARAVLDWGPAAVPPRRAVAAQHEQGE